MLNKLHEFLHIRFECIHLLQLKQDILVGGQGVLLSIIIQFPQLLQCGVLPGWVLLCHIDHPILWPGHRSNRFLVETATNNSHCKLRYLATSNSVLFLDPNNAGILKPRLGFDIMWSTLLLITYDIAITELRKSA